MATMTYDPTPADQPDFNEDEQDSLKVGEELAQKQAVFANKFQTPEELEKAYLELQQKMGAQGGETEAQDEPEAEEARPYNEDGTVDYEQVKTDYGDELSSVFETNGIDPYEMSDYFYENEGQLSEDHYNKLDQAGFNRDVVDSYLRGLDDTSQPAKDLSDQEVAAVKNTVGGEQQYDAMVQWAGQNLPAEYVQGFDNLVNSGNVPAIQMAVAGLRGLYEANVGSEGNMITGKAPTNTGSVFRSQAEVVQAMNDPRYDKDPAFRQDVFDRLERSNINF